MIQTTLAISIQDGGQYHIRKFKNDTIKANKLVKTIVLLVTITNYY